MNFSDEVLVNNNILPSLIVRRICENTWIEPTNKSNLLNLVLSKSPFKYNRKLLEGMMKDFCLYNLDCMLRESEAYKDWRESGEEIMFHGKYDPNINPGAIIPGKLILFADFGLGNDTPFGLDYQENTDDPAVVLLYYGKDSFVDNRWAQLTPSFKEFEKIVWS